MYVSNCIKWFSVEARFIKTYVNIFVVFKPFPAKRNQRSVRRSCWRSCPRRCWIISLSMPPPWWRTMDWASWWGTSCCQQWETCVPPWWPWPSPPPWSWFQEVRVRTDRWVSQSHDTAAWKSHTMNTAPCRSHTHTHTHTHSHIALWILWSVCNALCFVAPHGRAPGRSHGSEVADRTGRTADWERRYFYSFTIKSLSCSWAAAKFISIYESCSLLSFKCLSLALFLSLRAVQQDPAGHGRG